MSPDDFPPAAFKVLATFGGKEFMSIVDEMMRDPVMCESVLRGYEADAFFLTDWQLKSLQRNLEKFAPHLVDRLDVQKRKSMEAYGSGPMERALRAISEHNRGFLGEAVSSMDDLNEMVDKASLPDGYRLSNIFPGMKGAKSIELSRAGALMLNSLLRPNDFNEDFHAMFPGLLSLDDIKRPVARIKNSKGVETIYSQVDIFIRTTNPEVWMLMLSSKGIALEAARSSFSSALDKLIIETAAMGKSKKPHQLTDLQPLVNSICRLAVHGALPGVAALEQKSCVTWKAERSDKHALREEGPIMNLFPMKVHGPVISSLEPGTLWANFASRSMFEPLEKMAHLGADIHRSDNTNNITPLHVVAGVNNLDGAALMMKLGANEKAVDSRGATPRKWWSSATNGQKSVGSFDAIVQSTLAARAIEKVMSSPGANASAPRLGKV